MNKLLELFENLTQREKFIVLALLLVTLGGSWNLFFYQPIAQRQQALQQQQLTLNNQKALQQVAANRQKSVSADPNSDNQKKLDELKSQSAYQQKQIMLLGLKSFVSASSMADILNAVLTEIKLLKLLNLETLPATPLLDVKQHDPTIYKHELIITLFGDYINTLNYLKVLEALPWAIALDSIDYEVKDYPMAKITLHIVMLSFDKDLLDV